ncbi:MAG: hypothetical protein HYX48_03810 [Chlamydiales bacterium]|nr:hypothetical protein [Chlamydiales bacterium]
MRYTTFSLIVMMTSGVCCASELNYSDAAQISEHLEIAKERLLRVSGQVADEEQREKLLLVGAYLEEASKEIDQTLSTRNDQKALLFDTAQAERFSLGDDEDEDLEDPFLAPSDLPPSADADIADFSQLPLHEWEKQTIAYILTSMSDKNVFQLLIDKKDMERKGDKINHVHPLRFIGYACSDLKLKRALKLIKKNGFKWDNLIDGFSRRLREEATRNNVQRFIPGFAELLNVEVKDVTPFIQRLDCDGLVRFLIGN